MKNTKKILYTAALICVCVVTIFNASVSAISQDDVNSILDSTPFFQACNTITGSDGSTTNSSAPTIVLDPGHASTTDEVVYNPNSKAPGDDEPVFDYSNPVEQQQVWGAAVDVAASLSSAGYRVLITKNGEDDTTTDLKRRAEFGYDYTQLKQAHPNLDQYTGGDKSMTAVSTSGAALGVSIHTTPGSPENGNDVFIPKVGEYILKADGHTQDTFQDKNLQSTDTADGNIMRENLNNAIGAPFKVNGYVDLYGPIVRNSNTPDPQTPGSNYALKGTMLVTQYYATIPWLYLERYQDMPSNASVSSQGVQNYEKGILQGIENIVPTSGTGSSTNGGSSGSSGPSGSIYILGDSITAGAESDYQSALSKKFSSIYIDGAPSRSLATNPGTLPANPGPHDRVDTGLQALVDDKQAVSQADVIVIALGTNYAPASTVEIDTAIQTIRSENSNNPAIFWVNTFDLKAYNPGDIPVVDASNKAIAEEAPSQGFGIIPWATTVDSSVDPTNEAGAKDPHGYIDTSPAGIGVHPTPDGYKALTSLVAKSVSATADTSVSTTNVTPATACCDTGGASTPTTGIPNIQAAVQKAQSFDKNGTQVALSLYNTNGSTGTRVGGYKDVVNDGNSNKQIYENYGASITKSLLLVAYLRQLGTTTVSDTATNYLTDMIENSANGGTADPTGSAYWVYNALQDAHGNVNAVQQVTHLATLAGMTGFHADTSDSLYVLGQSKVTASDFARYFAKIDTYIPATNQAFALNLLANLSSDDQDGLLKSGLPGAVYSKEGWKGENQGVEGAPYIVNQAAQFSANGTKYGVAVTVGGTTDRTSGENIVQQIVAQLVVPTGSDTNSFSGKISPLTGQGMSDQAKQLFQQYAVGSGAKNHLDPNFIAAFYYVERGHTGDKTNNADATKPPPATGDGQWLEPAPPVGTGRPYMTNGLGYAEPYGLSNFDKVHYGEDGDGDGKINLYDLADAMYTAGNFLVKQAGAKANMTDKQMYAAAFKYNPAPSYAQSIVNIYHYLVSGGDTTVSGSNPGAGSPGCSDTGTLGADCQASTGDPKILSCAQPFKGVYYEWGGGHDYLDKAGGLAAFEKACPDPTNPPNNQPTGGPSIAGGPSGNPSPCATDCSGLVSVAVDIAFNQNFDWVVSSLEADTKNWKKLPNITDAQPGDVVTMGTAHVEIVDHYNSSTKILYTFGSHETKVKTSEVQSSISEWTGGAYRYKGPQA